MALKTIQIQADQLIKDNAELNNMYLTIENMINGNWGLPSELKVDGIHKVVSTDPYDAMNALRRILSKQLPKINIHPIAPNTATKERTDMMERGLSWIYKQSNKRRATDLTADLAWSAGAYGQVIGQVSFIPDEIKAREAFKGESGHLEQALQDSPFFVELHSPRFADVLRSSYMIEAVSTRKVMRLTEAIQFWGEYAGQLKSAYAKMSDEEKFKAYVTLFDWWDSSERSVWGVIRTDQNMASPLDDSVTVMSQEKHGLKFLPWFHRMTGTGLDATPRNQVMPMLKPVVDSGMYDTMNSLDTLIMSKAIKLFGRPAMAEEGPNPAKTDVDYDMDSLGQIAKVPAGNTLRDIRPEALDEALLEMSERVSARMDKATVSRLIQTGEFPANTAASAINIITQSAVESIGPYKRCAEQAVEDIVACEMKYIHYSGVPMIVDGAANVGEMQVIIDPKDINPNYIYVDVEITAVAPTDQSARALVGQQMTQMGYPTELVFEQMGETDGTNAMKMARKEQFVNAMMAAKLADIQLATQMKAAQAQMQLQQQAAQQQAASAQNSQPGQTPSTGMGGELTNTGAGGTSSVNASGATFESQRGATRDGTPMV